MAKTQVIDQLVRRRFPHPIAAAWHRAALATSHADRIKRLLVCQEIVARTLVAMILPDYLRGEPDPVVEQQLARLDKPSLGHWVGLMRSMLRYLRKREDPPPFLPQAVDWYFQKGRPSANAKLFDALVEVRNAEAHGHALSDTEAGERATRLLSDMRQLLGDLDWLAGYRMFRIHNAQLARRGGFQGMVQFLEGLEPQTEPQHATWQARLFPESVYLAAPDGSEILELSPFVQVLFDAGPRGERVYVLCGTRKSKMVMLQNDATGARENRLVVTDEGEVPIDQWLAQRAEHVLHQKNPGNTETLAAPHWQEQEPDAEILGGRFEVRDTLGQGGMATVYLVWDQWEEAEYALKVLRLQLAEEREFRERFKREARTMRRLRHPRILPVEETSQLEDGRLYLKLPVMRGGSVREQIVAGRIPEEQQLRWARQMLSALEYLHAQGVVHRDIKPGNFLLDPDGNVVLSDFGIALRETDTRLTKALDQIGSVAYMSPEQRRGGDADTASDLYSLGVVFHEMVVGAEGVVDPGVGLEGPLAPVIVAMTQVDPDARPTATQALALLPGGADGTAPPPMPEVPTVEDVWHHHGPAGQREGSAAEVVEAIRAAPTAQHLLWKPGWPSWQSWTQVGEIRDQVEQTAADLPVVPPPISEVDGVSIDTVAVEPGTFDMEGRATTLTRPFVLGTAPVSQALWEVVMGRSPSETFDSKSPVDSVRWPDVIDFCNALSARTGLAEAYTFGAWTPRKAYSVDAMGRVLYDLLPFKHVAQVLAHFGEGTLDMLQYEPLRLTEVPGIGEKTAAQIQSQWDPWKYYSRDILWNGDADGYRLPTEAEWVRGLDHGAAATERREWLWDLDAGPWFHPDPIALSADPATDPIGADEGPRRMVRSDAGRCCLDPQTRAPDLGFRIARYA